MRSSIAQPSRWPFFVEPSLLFIAFTLQLLISLSIPIIKVIVRHYLCRSALIPAL